MRLKAFSLALALLCFLPCCGGEDLSLPGENNGLPPDEEVMEIVPYAVSTSYYPPPESQGGWRKNTDPTFVQSLGLNPTKLQDLLNYSLSLPSTSWPDPHYKYRSAIVIKNGWIVAEKYNIAGARTFRQYISSNGKYIAAAALGIVANDGAIGSIPQKITLDSKVYNQAWLPQQGFPLSDSGKSQITFKHIMKHTSGIIPEWKEGQWAGGAATSYFKYVLGKDPVRTDSKVLYYNPGYPPPNMDTYSSVAFKHLGLIFRKIYGDEATFLKQRMLTPIGVGGVNFRGTPNPEFSWQTHGGLEITPRDYARFAYLLMKQGQWKDKQIVPSSWTRVYIGSESSSQYPQATYRISGSGLNWIFFVPSLDLMFVQTGRYENSMRAEAIAKELEKLFAAVLTAQTSPQKVASFTLVDADTNLDLGLLQNGATIKLSSLPTTHLNIRANTSPALVGSVKFKLVTATTTTSRLENAPPYTLAGDTGSDYLPWTPAPGSYVLTATPYTGSRASDTAGTSLTINFTVTSS